MHSLAESQTTLDFAGVRALAADDMAQVDALIRSRLASDVVLINRIADHIIAGGGKRLRPMLHVLAAGAAGYQGKEHAKLAAIIEFIHTSTLLHDDVVDESDMRRGRKTANALWGNAASVLVGDFLYSRSFQLMVELDDMRIMRILADTTNTIAEGEVLQLLNIGNADVDEAAYLAVIERKTAVLFAAATELGGVLGGWTIRRRRRFVATAWSWVMPSRLPTTCSITCRMRRHWARTSVTTWPRASRRCRSFMRCSRRMPSS